MRSKLIKCIFIMCFIVTSLIVMPTSMLSVQLINQKQFNQYDSIKNSLTLERLYIQLLPEFEKPRNWDKNKLNVLVSLSGELINRSNSNFHDYIYLPLPTDSSMFSLSMVSETHKGKIMVPYEVIDDHVRWKPSQPIEVGEEYPFTVEYHFNPIFILDSGLKEFTFRYTPEFKVPHIHVDVYLPQNSTEHLLLPTAQEHFIINNGIHVYSYQYQSVDYNQTIQCNVQYQTAIVDTNQSYTNLARDNISNDFFYTSVNFDVIGVIIFSLLLFIIGFSVIVLSSKSKIKNTSYVEVEENKENNIFDESQLRKKDLRKLLIQGKINEETYKSLFDEEEHGSK